MSVERDAVLALALGYPYPREPGAFTWRDGRVEPWETPADAAAVPVIAHGSNASPEHLERKFGDLTGIHIPTAPARLHGFDVVYAPKFARYGSIPATLTRSPGTTVEVWVQWLSPRALSRMDRTEGVPEFYVRRFGYEVATESVPSLRAAQSYLSAQGVLHLSGAPVALAEVSAMGRRFATLSQRAVQEAVREELGIVRDTESFIFSNVADPGLRLRRSAALPRGPADPPPGPPGG